MCAKNPYLYNTYTYVLCNTYNTGPIVSTHLAPSRESNQALRNTPRCFMVPSSYVVVRRPMYLSPSLRQHISDASLKSPADSV